ncbi:MAG: ABC transporter permease [Anaerolineales bacterium]|nr:ABC transporter permease [Anaerolineales bacterium]
MATMSSESRSDQTPAGSQLNRRQPAGRPLWLFYPASLLLLLLSWQLLVTLGGYDRFILPGPLDVARQFQIVIADGRLPYHTLVTLSEIIPGLLIGVLLATPVGYLLAKSPLAERLISPYLIASQAVPVIAIAPLIMIWIESVFWSRVAVAVLVVFFPILINVIAGLRHVPRPLYDLMTALQASRWQTFRKLELPAALPTLLAGLKVGATLSVIGTIVGEFVQPKSQGLGFLVNAARYQFKTDLVFVVILTLGLISLILYGAVALLERRLLRWQKED